MKKARAMYIPAGGKTAVWGPVDHNVLPEGYPYKEQSKVVLVEETSLTPANYGGLGLVTKQISFPVIVEGEWYAVTLNGTRYECVAKKADLYGNPVAVIGSADLVLGTVTEGEEPFAIYDGGLEKKNIVTVTNDTYTISISGMGETIHPMAPEFLPAGVGGGAFIVNVAGDDLDSLTADKTYAEISEALANGQVPCCVYGTLVFHLMHSNSLPGITTYVAANEHIFYSISGFTLLKVTISESDWVFLSQLGDLQFVAT